MVANAINPAFSAASLLPNANRPVLAPSALVVVAVAAAVALNEARLNRPIVTIALSVLMATPACNQPPAKKVLRNPPQLR